MVINQLLKVLGLAALHTEILTCIVRATSTVITSTNSWLKLLSEIGRSGVRAVDKRRVQQDEAGKN